MPIVDLHLHTRHSDGALSVTELIDYVVERSAISVAAIADHDTVSEISEARSYAQGKLTYLTAIEMTCRAESFGEGYPNKPLHILGYCFNARNSALTRRLDRRDADKKQAIENWLFGLRRLGIELAYEEITASKGTYILPNDIRNAIQKKFPHLCARQEVRAKMKEVESVLDAANPFAEEVISLIRSSGGAAIWAHPYQYYVEAAPAYFAYEQVETITDRLIEMGLQGLECFYEGFSLKEQALLYEIVRKRKLLCTAGSDFHNLQTRNRLVSASYPEMRDTLELLLSMNAL